MEEDDSELLSEIENKISDDRIIVILLTIHASLKEGTLTELMKHTILFTQARYDYLTTHKENK